MPEYVDMTGKWSRAMELLRQPALAERKAHGARSTAAETLEKRMAAFIGIVRSLALGAIFWALFGLFGYHVMGWWR